MTDIYKLKLEEINKKISLLIELFNTIIKDIKTTISKELPSSFSLNLYYMAVDRILSTAPNEPISYFIKNIYCNDIFRTNIIEGNDAFFSESSHDKLGVSKSNENAINTFFQFKTCWKDLTKEKQLYIKNAMKTLVQITKKYIEAKDNGNRLLSNYV
jgi:hypothetical protein